MRSSLGWLASAALALVVGTGCDCGTPMTDDGGLPDAQGMDAGRRDGGGDGGDDAAVPCSQCSAFQFCDNGRCRDYPACAGDGTCPDPEDVCHNRRCVPGDVDIDGDGSIASEDCDETNPSRFPGNTEICSGIDEDCNEEVDEGDPDQLCEFYPGGGTCIGGSCGCPPGTFDIDRSVMGCECMAEPAIDQGLSCAGAIDLGNLNDGAAGSSGQTVPPAMVTGNVLPDDREVYYRFRAVDSTDTSCDNFHVHVELVNNPDNTFEMAVFRTSCDNQECAATGNLTQYDYAFDFRATRDGRLSGECPCGTNVTGASPCTNNSSTFFVRIRRRPGSNLSCVQYGLHISNGAVGT